MPNGNCYAVCLSGPSAAGKSPLVAAIKEFYPIDSFTIAPVIKSTQSRPYGRPDEAQLCNDPGYFRSHDEIISLSCQPGYLVHETGDNGGSPHAICLDSIINPNGLVVVETCPTLVSMLKQYAQYNNGLKVVSVFLSPFSMREIEGLRAIGIDIKEYVSRLTEERLYARTKYHGQDPEAPLIKEHNLSRARSALNDLGHAPEYDHVLINRDGEGHPSWRRDPAGKFLGKPEGDASRAIRAFAEILLAGETSNSEHWPRGLFNLKE